MTDRTQDPDVISVMLVDDSAVIRGLMSRALKQKPELHIAATANDGEMAIDLVRQHKVDVIVLDIEMPKMDGLTALPTLLERSPNSAVLIVSTLSQRNAEISMQALSLGASDYIPKPSTSDGPVAAEAFYDELRRKVVALGIAARKGRHKIVAPKPATMQMAVKPSITPPPIPQVFPTGDVRAIAIASSTGGPQALSVLFHGLKKSISHVPVFVTQHMPAKFTTMLAEHMARDTGLNCREAVDGESVCPGTVYIAPGNYHMLAVKEAGGVIIRLNQNPPVNFCRPAADPMLTSLAHIYRSSLLTVILTGMGSDGLAGSQDVVAAGGSVIAQDEETSVVWGMPGAVTNAKLTKAVLPLQQIAPYVERALGGKTHAIG